MMGVSDVSSRWWFGLYRRPLLWAIGGTGVALINLLFGFRRRLARSVTADCRSGNYAVGALAGAGDQDKLVVKD